MRLKSVVGAADADADADTDADADAEPYSAAIEAFIGAPTEIK